MSIRTLNRIFYLTNGALVSFLAVFAVLLFLGQHELRHQQEVRYGSYLLADELRQSSDDLTLMARTYVITGDPKFEGMYWETLAIRNGEAPRPGHEQPGTGKFNLKGAPDSERPDASCTTRNIIRPRPRS